ncbi:4'-phosphopantetheinyl transferase family protein [Streptomyces sp. O3]
MPTRPDTPVSGYRAPAAAPGVPPGIDLWLIPLDDGPPSAVAGPGAPSATPSAVLSTAELDRARALRDPDTARRFTVAHAAVRTVLGGYLRRPPAALRWTTTEHGKPVFAGELRDWHWSLSRSGGYALLAVTRGAAVGADIERVGDGVRGALPLALRYLPPDEAAAVAAARGPHGRRTAYHRLLARKEACVKSVGGRLLEGLRLPVLRPGPVAARGFRWFLHDLPAPPGYVAAVAAATRTPGPLRLFAWPPSGARTRTPSTGAVSC